MFSTLQIRELFELVDTNGSGTLDYEELREGLGALEASPGAAVGARANFCTSQTNEKQFSIASRVRIFSWSCALEASPGAAVGARAIRGRRPMLFCSGPG